MKAVKSIPLNFTQTFLADRTLIARLLAFAASSGSGTKEQISEATGIPTGASSGKVEPMIYYALAMGLIDANRAEGVWSLTLSTVGEVVYEEDPYLNETITLWLLHLMMCRPLIPEEPTQDDLTPLPLHLIEIAGEVTENIDLSEKGVLSQAPIRGVTDAWFALFADRGFRLGNRFTLDAYTDYLTERHGKKDYMKKLTSLVVRMYDGGSILAPTSALTSCGDDSYQFLPAPNERSYYPLYSAYLLLLWDQFFPAQQQIQLSELIEKGKVFTLLNWSTDNGSAWLNWMSDHRIMQFDRQTGETLALRLQPTDEAIKDIYSLLI